MEDEVAKCIAEGIAEQALNAIEKKLKGMGEDFSEVEGLAGLGKICFCRVEDLKDNPDAQPIPLGEAVSINPGILSCKEDGDARPDYGAKGFSATLTGTMEQPSDDLTGFLKKPLKYDVEIRREMGKMPRRMKKAYRTGSRYRRDTKWKRKAKAYARHCVYRLPDAEIVVTRQQMGVLEATIKAASL